MYISIEKIWLSIVSVSLILGVSAALLLSCGAAVDIGETSKYLDRFEIVWPDGFEYSCINDVAVRITVRAIDQNGQVYTNGSGKNVAIEIQYGDVDVFPAFFDMTSGSKC
ncbi:MAG TPA: hypothetical protein VMZ05_02060 [Spirochaetota bacterium]|nr:hypothetical protein [Spirochaetota bacterium]